MFEGGIRCHAQHEAASRCSIQGGSGLEAMKEEKMTAQIASEYGVHPNQIRQWKKQILESLPAVFSDRRPRKEKQHEELVEELYRQIGQLKVELDWLKISIAPLRGSACSSSRTTL